MRLSGKMALVTGGSDGIGLATARLFLREGASVAVTSRDQGRLEKARKELGSDALVIGADVRSLDEMKAATRQVKSRFGSLDVLFANAGRAYPTPLASTAAEQYDTMMDTNVRGVFHTLQAALPILNDGASVVVNTSFVNQTGKHGTSLCAASKAAVRSLARSWSAELLDRKIRVNAVSPGVINTDIISKMGLGPDEVSEAKGHWAKLIPVGCLGKPEDIALAALYLASDESRYVVGAELVVDGGMSQL